jgi:ATP-binding cassette, subfamily B, bacterial
VRLLRMLGAASRVLVGAAVAAALVAGLLPIALILAGGALSARIQTAVGTDGAWDPVYRAFVVVIGIFLAGEVLVPLQNRLRWLVRKRVDGAVRERIMRDALAGTDMTRLHGEEYLDAMGLAEGFIRWSATPGGGAAGLIGVTREYVTGYAAAVVVATFNVWLGALALAAALVARVGWRRSTIGIVDIWYAEGRRDRREQRYLSELGLGRDAAYEIRLFGLADWLVGRIAGAGVRGWSPTWRKRKRSMGATTAIHLAVSGSAAVVALVWAARASSRGELSVGDLVVFVGALFAVLAMGRSFEDDMDVEYGVIALPALATLERLAAETVAREAGRTRLPRPDRPPEIELRGVGFRYAGGGREVLSDVDLVLPAGGSVALVGMNGAGKTTLVRLLCGLYPPDRGTIAVDGVDLRELDPVAWNRLVAPMFQGFLRLPTSATENVTAGGADADGAALALADAGALDFVQRLPAGPDSPLAARHAAGTDLSGGQWQRLGIARALFALEHGARLLILDEPTSNLDTVSEERLIARALGETRGRATTLLVTHRLSLARRADRIYVLEDGRVGECGTHAELLERAGRYASAFGMQASMYPLEEA